MPRKEVIKIKNTTISYLNRHLNAEKAIIEYARNGNLDLLEENKKEVARSRRGILNGIRHLKDKYEMRLKLDLRTKSTAFVTEKYGLYEPDQIYLMCVLSIERSYEYYIFVDRLASGKSVPSIVNQLNLSK